MLSPSAESKGGEENTYPVGLYCVCCHQLLRVRVVRRISIPLGCTLRLTLLHLISVFKKERPTEKERLVEEKRETAFDFCVKKRNTDRERLVEEKRETAFDFCVKKRKTDW